MFSKPRKLQRISLLVAAFMMIAACGVLTPALPADAPSLPAATEALPADVAQSATPAADPTGGTEPQTDDQTLLEIDPPRDLDQTFESFWEVYTLLNTYYVNQPIDSAVLAQGAVDGLLTVIEIPEIAVSDRTAERFSRAADTPRGAVDDFLPFWKLWAAAGEQQDLTLYRAALNGMTDSLGDQHTSYLDPDQYRTLNTPIEGSYEGIGAWVDTSTEYLTIVTPMPDSPAEAAGLLPGDQVIAVDGEDMTGIDGNLVIRRVLGPAGSEVTLTIRREGVEDFNAVIVRAEIIVPGLAGEILPDTNIAYVQLFTFGATTSEELRALLTDLLAQNPDGLIFDLRNNGGGLLTTSVEVASEFISDGVVLYEVNGDGEADTFRVLGDGLATKIPLVVLINGGSASASEIVAGAIQDYGRAPLVGTTSFGKGSVQNWIQLSDEGAVRITIAQWYTPNERLIHEIGLEPDFVVELTEADIEAGSDPQLDKAVELLSNN